jgi:electron transfer flavoprotein alpha subunit
MQHVLAIVETSAGVVRPASLELLTAAREMADGGTVTALVIGSDVSAVAKDVAGRGVDNVLLADHPLLDRYTTDPWARVIEQAVATANPALILLPGTTAGRDLGPYLAARAGTSSLSDCVALRWDGDDLVATRPVYGGKMLSDVRLAPGQHAWAVVRAGSYPAAEATGTNAQIHSLNLDLDASIARVTLREVEAKGGGSVNLETAERIVTGGRGVGSPEGFALIEQLAEALEAGVGATRAVTDAGWRPQHEQIGQTGRSVKPKLYVAAGVSGAVQHLAGMRGSDTIVAINRDADAPIFRLAAFGIIGDLNQILPALLDELRDA